jgi:hypothetical protein
VQKDAALWLHPSVPWGGAMQTGRKQKLCDCVEEPSHPWTQPWPGLFLRGTNTMSMDVKHQLGMLQGGQMKNESFIHPTR